MAEQKQKQIIDFTIVASIFVAILTVYVMISYLIQLKKIKYIHESTVAIIMGILTSVFCQYALGTTIQFSNQIFFAIILPSIIFSAGFSLRKSQFFQNIGLICFYGIVGTIIGFILISLVLIFLDRTFFHSLSLSQILIIGSVLCATDTISSSTLIKAQKYPILHSVLFGESIINDAVAIILFRTVSAFGSTKDEQFGFSIIMSMCLNFCYLFIFSMLLGIASGLFLSYIFRKFSFFAQHPIKETSIVLLNGYFTYLLGQIFSLSGIITLFTQSIIIGHYAFMNLSEQSKKATGMAFQTVSYIAEAFVFAYLGASILSVSENLIAVLMAVVLLLFLPFIRAFMVYMLPLFYKICGKQFQLKANELKVCWLSGIIRGVIAFALCLQVGSQNKQFLISFVLVIVLFTSVGGSSFMNKLIQIIKLEKGCLSEELEHFNNKNTLHEQKELDGQDNKDQKDLTKRSRLNQFLINFQTKYMQPLFGKVQSQVIEQSPINQIPSTNKRELAVNDFISNQTKSLENQIQEQKIDQNKRKSSNFNQWKPFQSISKNQ